jgi:uncharacterized protein (TIGR02145 family)
MTNNKKTTIVKKITLILTALILVLPVLAQSSNKRISHIIDNTNSKDNNLNKAITGSRSVKFEGSETWSKNIVEGIDSTTYLTAKSTDEPSDTSNNGNDLHDNLYDSRDGKSYKIVEIGTQLWMAENLAFKADDGCWAYKNSNNKANKYGYLYNYETAKNVCPDGWHLPSDNEWEMLAEYINKQNGPFSEYDNDWMELGKFLKSKSGWYDYGNGNDEFGFTALPSGYRGSSGSFSGVGDGGNWWSSTEKNSSRAWYRYLYYHQSKFGKYYDNKKSGQSVRCVK